MAPTTSPGDDALWLRPQAGGWTLQSTRQEWAGRLLQGRPADDAPRLLPLLYSLCGGAHRIAAQHAVAAAQGGEALAAGDALGAPAQARALRLETLREHLRRLWLDAPRQLAPSAALAAPDLAALARCPYLTAGDAPDEGTLDAGRRWVQEQVLGADVEEWLAGWQADAAGFVAHWCNTGTPWPARWLAACRQQLQGLREPVHAVRVPGSAADAATAGLSSRAPAQASAPARTPASSGALRRSEHPLALGLRDSPTFALAPMQDGRAAETGCWTRAADPLARAGSAAYAPLWLRHAARLAEVARLAGRHGDEWLAQGALTAAGQEGAHAGAHQGAHQGAHKDAHRGAHEGVSEGLGWCEMARGLLVHWVQLDGQGRVARYRVLAPTEWNFHAQGGAAHWLASLAGAAAARVVEGGVEAPALDFSQVRAVAAAYDPCVELHIEGGALHREAVDPQHPTSTAAAGGASHA